MSNNLFYKALAAVSTAGLLSPIAAKADKTFLIMEFGVEMVDMKQCEQEGERWLASQQVTVRGQKPLLTYQCKEFD